MYTYDPHCLSVLHERKNIFHKFLNKEDADNNTLLKKYAFLSQKHIGI